MGLKTASIYRSHLIVILKKNPAEEYWNLPQMGSEQAEGANNARPGTTPKAEHAWP